MIYGVILGALGASLLFCIVIALIRNRYNEKVVRMNNALEQLLHKKEIEYSDIDDNDESETMALIRRVEKMIQIEAVQGAEENEAVKSFISNISHQLKTPLANISLYGELLEEESIDVEKRREFVKKIRQEALKLEWLLKNLFKISRMESGVIEFESAPEYIKKTITMAVSAVYNAAMEKNIRISIEAFEDRQLLHNRKWTVEAMTNILENAIKYSESHTSIEISVETLDTFSVINIRDEGIGIPLGEFSQVFKRFYRGKNVKDKEGSGIGLYLTRLILMKEHGNVTIQANKDKGSCFRIFLQNCKTLK